MPDLPNHLEWQLVQETWTPGATIPQAYTYRAKVPGGWLVSIWAGENDDHGLGGGLTFVPDPTWGWELADRKLKLPKNP
jgi:hypothetical protein